MDKRDWRTPTTWNERFREALTILCGEPPPEWMVNAWFEPGCESMDLQNWAAEKARMPWAQGIVVIDAAEMLADTPAEGGMHAPHLLPNTISTNTEGQRRESAGPQS